MNRLSAIQRPTLLTPDGVSLSLTDHARSAIAEWAEDYNHFRPHSSLGYQTPADYAGTIAATGSNAAQDESFAFPPVAHTAPFGVFKAAEALTAAG